MQPCLTTHALCVQAHAGKPWPTWRSSRTTRSRLGSASSTWKNTPTTSTSHGPNAPAWWTARSCASASTRPSWGPAGRKWDSTSVWGEWVGFFLFVCCFFSSKKTGINNYFFLVWLCTSYFKRVTVSFSLFSCHIKCLKKSINLSVFNELLRKKDRSRNLKKASQRIIA